MQVLTNLDLAKNELQNARIQNLAADPINPVAGQIYFHSSDKTFYGWTGAGWIDLGTLTGDAIVLLINASSLIIDNDNLSAGVNDALSKQHTHANSTVLSAIEVAFTNALKTKLDGIATGANKYIHPGTGTNPHGTTKADVQLGDAENKSSATIRGEISSANVTGALGFTPVKNGGSVSELMGGAESDRPTASGSGMVYFAIDTKRIWKDTDVDVWTGMGGEEGLPIASAEILGGVKIGANLTIGADGTLNANDNAATFIIKHERFTIADGQTTFTLTKGTYKPGTKTIFWFLDGVKQDSDALIESSNKTFTIPPGLPNGLEIMVEYYETFNASPFPFHASEHIGTGADAIPNALTTQDGLMSAADKLKLNGIAASANKYTHPSTHSADIITQDANNRFMTDVERTKLSGIATGANKYTHPSTHSADVIVDGETNHAFTAEDDTKLSGIATGANKYTHPSTHSADIITQDASNRFVTDAEKTAWTAKANASHTHTPSNVGLGSVTNDAQVKLSTFTAVNDFLVGGGSGAVVKKTASEVRGIIGAEPAFTKKTGFNKAFGTTADTVTQGDDSRLSNARAPLAHTHSIGDLPPYPTTLPADGGDSDTVSGFTIGVNVPTGAKFTDTVYTHPTKHPSSIITQDANNRFVTDAEKTTWNAKETTTGAQTKVDAAIASLVDSSPTTLNTLNELAAALGDDPNFATTITNLVATKTKKGSANIGNGLATSFNITHNLGTLDTAINIRESATGSLIWADTQTMDANTIKVSFASAPTTDQYRVTVVG